MLLSQPAPMQLHNKLGWFWLECELADGARNITKMLVQFYLGLFQVNLKQIFDCTCVKTTIFNYRHCIGLGVLLISVSSKVWLKLSLLKLAHHCSFERIFLVQSRSEVKIVG